MTTRATPPLPSNRATCLSEILQVEVSVRQRLPPLAAFCKTDASSWVADPLRSASAPDREPIIGGANLAGGVGAAFGALIGSALIEVIRNSLGLLGINAFWQGTFVGAFIIVAVSFDSIRSFRQAE